jgi:hypothetical protein
MPELLLFAQDHSTDTTLDAEQLAALPTQWDLIAWRADGWPWGDEELSHPWFRILSWPDALPADLDILLSPKLPELDVNDIPTTLWQFRSFFVDVSQLGLTPLLQGARSGGIVPVPPTAPPLTDVTTERPDVPDPDYVP